MCDRLWTELWRDSGGCTTQGAPKGKAERRNSQVKGQGAEEEIFPRLLARFFVYLREEKDMKAIVTVIGEDQVGIIADVTTTLAKQQVNVLDISQTIMQQFFTMMMLVDVSHAVISFEDVQKELKAVGEKMNVSIQIQNEEIYHAMHRL
jgi:ACT domain-containing protein